MGFKLIVTALAPCCDTRCHEHQKQLLPKSHMIVMAENNKRPYSLNSLTITYICTEEVFLCFDELNFNESRNFKAKSLNL